MIDRKEIEAAIDQMNTDMLAWATGNLSHRNEFFAVNSDPERRAEVLMHVAQADAAEVVRLSAALQAYAALLLAVPPEVSAKISVVHEEDLRSQLYTCAINKLRDRVVQINHDQGTNFEVNRVPRSRLVDDILDRLSLQEIVDFLEDQKW